MARRDDERASKGRGSKRAKTAQRAKAPHAATPRLSETAGRPATAEHEDAAEEAPTPRNAGEDVSAFREPAPRLARLPRALLAGGALAVLLGALGRVFIARGDDLRGAASGLAIAGLVGIALGLALDRRPRAAANPRYDDDDGARLGYARVRLIVTVISGASAALGLGLLIFDSLDEEEHGYAWPSLIGGALGLVVSAVWSAAAAPRPPHLIEGPPVPASRRLLIATAALAILVAQGLVPLRYYLGDDLFDERFSWRMFSAVRVYECNLTAFETRSGVEQPVDLMRTVQAGWVTTLRRSREDVMARYLGWRCEQEGVEAARLVNRCTTADGNAVPDVVRRIDCGDGVVLRVEVTP